MLFSWVFEAYCTTALEFHNFHFAQQCTVHMTDHFTLSALAHHPIPNLVDEAS